MPAATQNGPPNFERMVLPPLEAAYDLARWLMRNEQDAQDVVQEAYLRGFRFFGGFRGGDARGWPLKIVRNASYTWLGQGSEEQNKKAFHDALSCWVDASALFICLPLQSLDKLAIKREIDKIGQ